MSSRLPMCLSLLLGLVSCRGDAPSSSPRPADQALAATTTETATQLELARELAASEAAPDPDAALAELRARWQGRRLTWTVTRQEPLCRAADACHVAPFPTPAPEGTPRVGWMPALSFAPGQFEKLTAACGGAALCTVTFEGELDELVASMDLPTSIAFTNVSIVTATAAQQPSKSQIDPSSSSTHSPSAGRSSKSTPGSG